MIDDKEKQRICDEFAEHVKRLIETGYIPAIIVGIKEERSGTRIDMSATIEHKRALTVIRQIAVRSMLEDGNGHAGK